MENITITNWHNPDKGGGRTMNAVHCESCYIAGKDLCIKASRHKDGKYLYMRIPLSYIMKQICKELNVEWVTAPTNKR